MPPTPIGVRFFINIFDSFYSSNYNGTMEDLHKKMSTIDVLSELGELEHLRRHCLLAMVVAPDEERLPLLVLASQCQKARRELQKKYFPDTEERNWCILKSSARLLQLWEELANGDADELTEIKDIINSAVQIATGEDISNCEACAKDFSEAK